MKINYEDRKIASGIRAPRALCEGGGRRVVISGLAAWFRHGTRFREEGLF